MEEAVSTNGQAVCPGTPQPIHQRIRIWLTYGICMLVLMPIAMLLLLICGIGLVTFAIFFTILSLPVSMITHFWAGYTGFHLPSLKYQGLTDEHDSIRLIEILPGAWTDPLRCRLVSGRWETSEYEALSYTWGCETAGDVPCYFDDKMLLISRTLHRAIRCLRHDSSARTLWVDAICINQKDTAEKSQQVHHMKEIYQHARNVVIWLDVDSWDKPAEGSIGAAFDMAKNHLEEEQAHESIPSTSSHPWTETFNMLFRLRYWSRMRIIQEIASNRNVVVQCRLCTLPWESICQLVTSPSTPELLNLPDGLQEFVHRVEAVRAVNSADPDYGVLTLIHDFRYSLASDTRDRLYALRGLIKDPESSPIIDVDYSKKPVVIWNNFTKQCIAKYEFLNALSITDSEDRIWWDATGSTWVPGLFGGTRFSSKRLEAKAVRQPLWMGTSRDELCYSASGASKARCRTNLPDSDIIAVQGFTYDTIRSVGDIFRADQSPQKQKKVLKQWRTLAEEHDQNNCPSEFKDTFYDTLTAGMRPADWNLDRLFDDHTDYTHALELNGDPQVQASAAIHAACNRRRLFLTKHNRTIGLAHSQAKPGDLVCILLGSAVPYILRRMHHDRVGLSHPVRCWVMGCKRKKHLYCCIPEHYGLVGQAYVRNIMQYRGDMEKDIETGAMELREFFLE